MGWVDEPTIEYEPTIEDVYNDEKYEERQQEHYESNKNE